MGSRQSKELKIIRGEIKVSPYDYNHIAEEGNREIYLTLGDSEDFRLGREIDIVDSYTMKSMEAIITSMTMDYEKACVKITFYIKE